MERVKNIEGEKGENKDRKDGSRRTRVKGRELKGQI